MVAQTYLIQCQMSLRIILSHWQPGSDFIRSMHVHEVICWAVMTIICRCQICLTSTHVPKMSMCKYIPCFCVSLQIQQYTLPWLLGQGLACVPRHSNSTFFMKSAVQFGQVAAQHQANRVKHIISLLIL